MKILTPNLASPVVGKDGVAIKPWSTFFTQLTAAPSSITPVTVSASPFSLQVSEKGTVSVVSGTVSLIEIIRGGGSTVVTLDTGLIAGLFPVGAGDTIRITYTVIPTVNFVPG